MGTRLTASGKAQVRIGRAPIPRTGRSALIVALIEPKGPTESVARRWRRSTEPPIRRCSRKIGMPLIWGFKKTSDPNAFEDGHIYNGENGKTYNANISLQPDGKLRLRGYVGTPMFGETQLWTRVN
jgi:uncharacterized protein (DUF2147 family)